MHQSKNQNSPYIIFSREEWANLGFGATLNLTENEIIELRGLNEPMSIDEVRDVYLPISRLLNLYISGTEKLFEATNLFLGKKILKYHLSLVLEALLQLEKAQHQEFFKLYYLNGQII